MRRTGSLCCAERSASLYGAPLIALVSKLCVIFCTRSSGPWGRVQCDGHTEVTTDTSIPCTCDNYPEAPTCTPEYPYDYGYLRGGAPSWYNNQNWTRPERRRERDSLRDLAREYNANGDLEDDDFENRQHRHEGIWNWWG